MSGVFHRVVAKACQPLNTQGVARGGGVKYARGVAQQYDMIECGAPPGYGQVGCSNYNPSNCFRVFSPWWGVPSWGHHAKPTTR